MKLWIATDDLETVPIIYTRRPERLVREGFVVWSPCKGDVMSAIGMDLKDVPPPGECWEFDVEFRRTQ